MSIDDIIAALDNYEPGSLSEETVTAIKTALKAGQGMRDCAQMTAPAMNGDHTYRVISQEAFSLSVRTWDAATKEEEG